MVDKRVKSLTVEEKAKFVRGKTTRYLHSNEDKGIKRIKVNDGPHGLRVEIPNSKGVFKPSYTAICFPSACATSCSFSKNTLALLGETLAKEAKTFGTHILLGPGVNIKRNPLCGRNFEYFSEDPFLVGTLAASYIKAVQKEGIGTSIKHYALNNQETLRSSINSTCDIRAMREIYLYAFEKAIEEAQPYTIMASYNMVNGEYVCESKYLLTDLAKKEFGFKGFIMSDWGAVNNINESIKAGLDLEMPFSPINEKISLESLSNDLELINDYERALDRQLKIIDNCLNLKEEFLDEKMLENHHMIAKEIAIESMVLLKNEKNVLPLNKNEKVLFVGAFAHTPRYQGGGSSHIASYKVDSFLDLIKDNSNYMFNEGYKLDLSLDNDLIDEVIKNAKNFDKVVCFLGLTEKMESEGFDRTTMTLPRNQIDLVETLYKNGIKPIVILENGSAVEIPFDDKISGLIECYLGGEAINLALYDVLFGNVSPSGRLSETFVIKYDDYPSSKYFPGDLTNSLYKESVYVGYRYFDKVNKEVLYPFGYGLSYSEFEYSDLQIMKNSDDVIVTFKIKNVGKFKAKEVAMLYISKPQNHVFNAVKELKGFEKVELNPNEFKEIQISISKKDLSYFDIKENTFVLSDGNYVIQVGSNSKNLFLKGEIYISGSKNEPYNNSLIPSYMNGTITNVTDEEYSNLFENKKIPLVKETKVGNYDFNTSITYALKDSKGAQFVHNYLSNLDIIKAKPYILKMFEDLPIRMLASNFGLTKVEQMNYIKDLFNDIDLENNIKRVLMIFDAAFKIIAGK